MLGEVPIFKVIFLCMCVCVCVSVNSTKRVSQLETHSVYEIARMSWTLGYKNCPIKLKITARP